MASIGAGPGDREGEAHAGKDRQRKGRQDLECAIDSIRQVSCFESFLMRQSEEALLDAMKAAATEQPLLYLLAGELGGVALILRSDGTVSCFDLPRLTSAALSVLVQGDVSQPVTAIDLISHALWPLVGASLAEILEREQIVATTVIPLGALGMVPLHAAWTEDPRRPTGRLHLCDMVRFSYAPSAQALRNATTARSVDAQSILAVDDPQPSLGPPLTASAAEVTNAVSWFTTKTVIGRHDATKAAVIAALGKADVVHFSCHGSAVEIDPLQSFLALSDGRLTLGDLLGVDLADTRLVVLSACETARPGTTLLDEVISLPTGLLQVGVRASIGSLWSVEQNATAVLLSRFYELWRGEGIALAEALHQAQVWVRDSTEQEIRTSYPRIPVRSGGSPDCRPYSSPFWWAAFTVTGA
jgi:CHAT domain-containing protein